MKARAILVLLLTAAGCSPTATAQPTAGADTGLVAACGAVAEANVLILSIRGAGEFLGTAGWDDPEWTVHQQEISAGLDDLTAALEPVPDAGRFREWKVALLQLGVDAADLALSQSADEALRASESALDHATEAARLTGDFQDEC